MYTIDDLRQIDDADLDAYQRSMMFHFWRVGYCWESLRTTAKKTGMSLGKAKQVRDWLLENDYIRWEPAKNGKMSIVLECSRGEQTQQLERSRGEQCSCGEQKCSCGERHLKKPIEGKNIYIAPASDLNAAIQTELSQIAKEVLAPGFNEKKFEDAAFALIGWDAEPEQVAGFAAYWKHYGWHKNKPALTNIVNHWQDYLAGRDLRKKPSSNGSHADDNTVWELVLKHARQGNTNFTDPALTAAVRSFGWPKLQSIRPGDENFYRREFLRIYHDKQTAPA